MALTGTWKQLLESATKTEKMLELKSKILLDQIDGKEIYPPLSRVFEALDLVKFEDVKVVIIGQDPYHGPGQAHGLSFSVEQGVVPPSLKNIYKELASDIGMNIPAHGNLSSWAKQGVLLLNNVLTVERGKPGSHRKLGWEEFTDLIVKELNARKTGLVFLLWGRDAQTKCQNVDNKKHLVLTAAHPSPFSADKGFFGCKHFSKANEYLKEKGYEAIDWKL